MLQGGRGSAGWWKPGGVSSGINPVKPISTMKLSIESLLANVVHTQAAFESAKTALFLAKLENQREDDAARLEEYLIETEYTKAEGVK